MNIYKENFIKLCDIKITNLILHVDDVDLFINNKNNDNELYSRIYKYNEYAEEYIILKYKEKHKDIMKLKNDYMKISKNREEEKYEYKYEDLPRYKKYNNITYISNIGTLIIKSKNYYRDSSLQIFDYYNLNISVRDFNYPSKIYLNCYINDISKYKLITYCSKYYYNNTTVNYDLRDDYELTQYKKNLTIYEKKRMNNVYNNVIKISEQINKKLPDYIDYIISKIKIKILNELFECMNKYLIKDMCIIIKSYLFD